MKDSSSSGPRKGRSRNYNNKNRNNNRRHIKQKVPRRAKKKSLIKRILEFFGIGKSKPKKKTSKKNPRNNNEKWLLGYIKENLLKAWLEKKNCN